ncbi:MAG TPA: nucleotidyltransferase domain-containing protein [Bryobacteraceae bacterium]|nr:nucleotidyltransferase domain-containing protein [Bryobacteraceae bacterium]
MAISTNVSPEQIVQRLHKAGHPQRIVLFGSRARHAATEHSDYDLLIVEQSELPRSARAAAYYRALSDLPIEVDVLVFTPEEVRDWSQVPQAFVTAALRERATLYEEQG